MMRYGCPADTTFEGYCILHQELEFQLTHQIIPTMRKIAEAMIDSSDSLLYQKSTACLWVEISVEVITPEGFVVYFYHRISQM